MASKFGRGFIINLMHISNHFVLTPEKAFYGVADHLDDLILPDQFRGTEVESLVNQLRKHLIWHQPGPLDREEAAEITRILNRLVVAIDRALGIKDPDIGEFR
jgi:hypothetical protein